jgi:hypothetical protein
VRIPHRPTCRSTDYCPVIVPGANVVRAGFETVRAGRAMKLLVDRTA